MTVLRKKKALFLAHCFVVLIIHTFLCSHIRLSYIIMCFVVFSFFSFLGSFVCGYILSSGKKENCSTSDFCCVCKNCVLTTKSMLL